MLKVCEEYSRRIGNEIGWADYNLEYKLNEVLENIKPEFKEGINNLNKEAKQANYKKSIIYLLSLFEAFMYDFISEKEKLDDESVNTRGFWKNYLAEDKVDWENYNKNLNIPISNSASLMNIRYSLFILKKRYNISYPSDLTNLVFELGSLRNCIVHHTGNILIKDVGNKYLFKDTLKETIKFLNMDLNVNNISDFITFDYIQKITFDLQKFIIYCDDKNINI